MEKSPFITISLLYEDDSDKMPGCQVDVHPGHEKTQISTQYFAWLLACCARDLAENFAEYNKMGAAGQEQVEAKITEYFVEQMRMGEHQEKL